MFNITERIRRRMLRWLLVGVDPELVRRALKTINGGTTKHGTVSIDASNITLPGLVDGVDVSGIPHDAAGVPYALDKRGDTMSGLLKVEMGGTNVRLYGYESLGYVGSVGDLILFASDIPQMNLSSGWIYSKNFLPYADATYGLGYSGYRWSNLYLSGNAIIDGLVDGVDVGSHDHSGGTMGPAPLALTAIPEHGAAKHINVTRELFIPATEDFSTNATVKVYGLYAVVELAYGVSGEVRFSFKVPDDFVSFTSLKAVWLATVASGNVRWAMLAQYAASGEQHDTHYESRTLGETATGGDGIMNVQAPVDPLTLSALTKGDYLGIRLYRDGSHENDTLESGMSVLGLLFTYVAEQ